MMRTSKRLDEIDRHLDRIYTALVVRDPGTPLSADAYEGLRKQVVAGAGERRAHLVQLTEFDLALRRGASIDDLVLLTKQWLAQAGVDVVDDPSRRELYEGLDQSDVAVEVELPAYVERDTARLIRQGRMRRTTQVNSAQRRSELDE